MQSSTLIKAFILVATTTVGGYAAADTFTVRDVTSRPLDEWALMQSILEPAEQHLRVDEASSAFVVHDVTSAPLDEWALMQSILDPAVVRATAPEASATFVVRDTHAAPLDEWKQMQAVMAPSAKDRYGSDGSL